MEALLVFIIAIGIVILQIIMIAKFFQIAADVRDIKNIQSRRMTENTTKTGNISIDSNPNYSLNGEDVTFRDGLTGKIKFIQVIQNVLLSPKMDMNYYTIIENMP